MPRHASCGFRICDRREGHTERRKVDSLAVFRFFSVSAAEINFDIGVAKQVGASAVRS
jgi:hypothetical protein